MGNIIFKQPVLPSPSSVDKLTILADNIAEKTRIVAEELRSKNLEAPSFDPLGSPEFPLAQVSSDALQAREDLIAQTKELYDILLGPVGGLKLLAFDTITFVPIQLIVDLDIAKAVPVDEPISYEDLASRIASLSGVSIPYTDLRRHLRLAMFGNIFSEPEKGFVAHNSRSLVLRDNKPLASWVGMCIKDNLPYIARAVDAMVKWPGSQEPNETAVNLAHNHDLKFFDHLLADRSRAERFNHAMVAHGAREGFEVHHTVESYPWAELGNATVVDMGGAEGHVSVALAKAFPSLSFIVQDQDGFHSDEMRGKIPKDLSGRVTLATHDFFKYQPVVADAYFFRHIFHGFSDKYCLLILRALIPALRSGARIIIHDLVLPAPGELPYLEEKSIRMMDVLMQTVCNAKERDVDDWKDLFQQADPRFQWKGAWKSSGRLWFMEAIWESE